MNLDEVPISISGIDYTMGFNFFERLDIVEENLIGDTYFIKSKDQHGYFRFSVHKNYYDIIKRDLKIKKILK
jgi:hypothetical protein